jgi:hypothetical protein
MKMLSWFLDLFKPKDIKYPIKINDKVTQTSATGYLVGTPRPFKRPDVSVIPKSTFDYFNKPESERVSKPLDGYTIYTKETEMNTEQLQTQLMQAVAYHFDKDAIRPGVVTSSLRNGKIYASVVRYGKQFSGGKKVVVKASGSELKEVLTTLSTEFLSTIAGTPSPVDALKSLVSDKPKKS